jgi:hypothetical protein
VWIFLFTVIGMLSIIRLTEGDTRRYYLQGAFVGSIASVIVLINVFVFVALR